MYKIIPSTKFKKDLKAAIRRGYPIPLMDVVVNKLAAGRKLAPQYRDHALSGKWAGHRECHIANDWLLVYKIEQHVLVLTLTRTGTHSDLFE